MIEIKEEVNINYSGSPIIEDEFEKVLMKMKDGKATGIDEIPATLLKYLEEDMHNILYEIIIKNYQTGNIPEKFFKTELLFFLRKKQLWNVSNFIIISILPHASKIFLGIRKVNKKFKWSNM